MENAEIYLWFENKAEPGKNNVKYNPIVGEATSERYKGSIEISSWEWAPKIHAELQEDGVRATPGELTISKTVDAASNKLMNAVVQQTPFEKAIIIMLQRRGSQSDSIVGYTIDLTLTIENVLVKSCQINIADGADGVSLTEDVTLAFEKMAIDYTIRAKALDGGEMPSTYHFEMPRQPPQKNNK